MIQMFLANDAMFLNSLNHVMIATVVFVEEENKLG